MVRDFQPYGSTNLAGLDSSPDFEQCTGGGEKGIVAAQLAMVNGIGKPVYAKTSELPVSLACHIIRHHNLQQTSPAMLCDPESRSMGVQRGVQRVCAGSHSAVGAAAGWSAPGTCTNGSTHGPVFFNQWYQRVSQICLFVLYYLPRFAFLQLIPCQGLCSDRNLWSSCLVAITCGGCS